MGSDNSVDINRAVTSGRRDEFLLRCSDHRMQVLGLVLEHLDKLNHAAVTHVKCAVEIEHTRVAFRVGVELGYVLGPDQHRGILVIWINGRDDANSTTFVPGKGDSGDRNVFVAPLIIFFETITADRTELALHVHVEHLFELPPQVLRNQVQRFLGHRTTVNRVHRIALFEPYLQLIHDRALASTYGSHQIQHLAAFLAVQCSGMKVTHNLSDCTFDAKEFILEEVVDL